MTATGRSAELRVTAALDGSDPAPAGDGLHSPRGAHEYGYEGALVLGVTVYGWATPPIVEALGDRWLERGWAEIAFRHPVYAGDELLARVEPADGEIYALRVTKQDGTNAVVGRVGLGDAPWLGDLRRPRRVVAEPRPATLPGLTLASAPVGDDLRPLSFAATPEAIRDYALSKHFSNDARFAGERPLLPPSWLVSRMSPLTHHNWEYGPGIHARTDIQHLARAESGQTLTAAANFLQAYERKGHKYAVLDGLILAEDGRELARMRHTFIFEIAKRGDA